MHLKLKMLFLILTTAAASLVAFSSATLTPTLCETTQCVAVVDAGSTGSRLHLYTYTLNDSKNPTGIKEQYNKKIGPGLATIALQEEAIDNYLSTLMKDLKGKNIPVYFYSTGGMRLLSHSKQKHYYKEIKKWFQHQSTYQLEDIKTISGQEEAVFDWLSVNYTLGHFDKDTEQYAGVMDMGGASVQVVFPITSTLVQEPNKQVDVIINGKGITLFAHSFLGLGQTEVSHQFINDAACYARGYPLADGDIGFGDAPSCVDNVSHLLNDVQHVSTIIQKDLKNQPPLDWYALGGISYLTQESYFEVKNNRFTPAELLTKAHQNLCETNWDTLEANSGDEYLYSYCFNASYYYALMVNGYGLTDYTPINTLPKEKNADWSLGVVLLKKQA